MPGRNSQSMVEVMFQPEQQGIARNSQMMVEIMMSVIPAPAVVILQGGNLIFHLPHQFGDYV